MAKPSSGGQCDGISKVGVKGELGIVTPSIGAAAEGKGWVRAGNTARIRLASAISGEQGGGNGGTQGQTFWCGDRFHLRLTHTLSMLFFFLKQSHA
ncbi:MAG: hypothetical protein KUG81_08635, partial [Gammaproteobacteria bacterium]|nr:hypothetical protein [Gammaproteobacteria bacterium]